VSVCIGFAMFVGYVCHEGECVCWICHVVWASACVRDVVFYG
jgi:hypothetical protein